MKFNCDREELTKDVLKILEEVVMDDSVYTMNRDANLVDELDLDSMDLLDIGMEVKQKYKEYNVKIEREDYAHVRSLNDLVDFVISILKKSEQVLDVDNNAQTLE